MKKEISFGALGLLIALLCCSSAMAIEAQSAGAEQAIQISGGGMVMANSEASVIDMGGFSGTSAGNNLFAAGGAVNYNQFAHTNQQGGDFQQTDVSNTAVAMGFMGVTGSQTGITNQNGADDSTAYGSNLAVLSAVGPVNSHQDLYGNGYGKDTAYYSFDNTLIAESLCDDVNAGQGISLIVDPKVINAQESNYMNVYAGDDANLGQTINANLGATEQIANFAGNGMQVMARDDITAYQGIAVNERLWGNSPNAFAINSNSNGYYGLSGGDTTLGQSAQGTTTTGHKADVLMSSMSDANAAFGNSFNGWQNDAAVHYIV